MAIHRDTDALLIVDLQNDFCPGGALAVSEGDAVVAPLNEFATRFDTVVASQDWHPPDHVSFAAQPRFVDGSWPVHCVANTPGAALHAALRLPANAHLVHKATARDREAYSAFDGTGLAQWLRDRGIQRLFVGGLATDFCVQASVLDARQAGFDVVVLQDAVRAVADHEGALQRMREAGAEVTDTKQLSQQ